MEPVGVDEGAVVGVVWEIEKFVWVVLAVDVLRFVAQYYGAEVWVGFEFDVLWTVAEVVSAFAELEVWKVAEVNLIIGFGVEMGETAGFVCVG